jgi:hypothetical protein
MEQSPGEPKSRLQIIAVTAGKNVMFEVLTALRLAVRFKFADILEEWYSLNLQGRRVSQGGIKQRK